MLTVADVAELLVLNQQTVRNMIDRGDLPAFKVGRRVRIRQADLADFLAREPVVPTSPPLEPTPQPTPTELAARERLAETSRSVAALAKRRTNEPLIAALIELSEAARILAAEISAASGT